MQIALFIIQAKPNLYSINQATICFTTETENDMKSCFHFQPIHILLYSACVFK